jgi:hypothetical protein
MGDLGRGSSQSGQDEYQMPGGGDMQDDSSAEANWPPMGEQPMGDEQSQGDEGDDQSASMPVTEDTMESAGDGEDEAEGAATAGGDETESAGQDAEYSMPDVVPMMGSYPDADSTSGQTGSGDEMGATESGTTSGGDGAWASAALNYLEQAQQSAGQGDWASFGEALGNLRTYLQTASQGVQSSFSGSEMSTGASSMQSPAMGDGTAGSGGAASSMGGMEMGDTGASSSMGDMGMSSTSEPMGSMESMPDMSGGSSMVGGSEMESAPLAAGDGDSYSGEDAGGGVATLEPSAEAGSLGADAAAETAEGETTMARLVMIATGAELPLPSQEEITVGREDPSSGIFPDIDLTPYGGEDGGVSRRHARLINIGDEFFVEDLQSTNYTKLDGQRLPAHVRERLEDGARLDFGRVATIFRRS